MSLDDFEIVHVILIDDIVEVILDDLELGFIEIPSFLEEIPADAFTDQIAKEIGKAHDTHGCRCTCNDYLALGSRMLLEMVTKQSGGALPSQIAEAIPAGNTVDGSDESFVFVKDFLQVFIVDNLLLNKFEILDYFLMRMGDLPIATLLITVSLPLSVFQ